MSLTTKGNASGIGELFSAEKWTGNSYGKPVESNMVGFQLCSYVNGANELQ